MNLFRTKHLVFKRGRKGADNEQKRILQIRQQFKCEDCDR